ncbi:MAG TPA: S53 family peptidase [Acidobacteriaceae bacterium]|nr:S53 family peptidase [Acidobacteriaceae bacterium]
MSQRIALPGSKINPLHGAQAVGPANPEQRIEVSVILKQRRELKLGDLRGRHLSHDEFAAAYGADPDHLGRVKAFAAALNLTVIEHGHELARRTVKLQGTIADLENAFGTSLQSYDSPRGHYRGRTGEITIPADLADVVQAVFGLDNRPVAKPHFRRRSAKAMPHAAPARNLSYSPVQVAQLYQFPTNVNGAGQTIGIIELGGGYQPADITNYFQSLGINAPTVTSVSVDGGTNSPTTPDSADGEVLLDIEVAGAVAPGAKIVVYFTTNTAQGFQDALSTAIHDTTNNPSVISISWGAPEDAWTSQFKTSFDQVAQEAAALGVTITVAAGDDGSSDGDSDGGNHVDFPASSPHVLGCGGTNLQSSNGSITGETVWNDGQDGGATGGGYSTFFAQPSYQSGIAKQTMRGVPDVAGDADPDTGYNVLVDGEQTVVGGTSAVAPLWAGLIALINQQLGRRLGYINAALYALPESQAFNDITHGNNGSFSAGPGWDACTGLGSPIGTQLATLLANTATNNATAAEGGTTTGAATPAP